MRVVRAGWRPSRLREAGLRGVFVTGTGTGVGKTVVGAAIARTLAAEGASVAVFKPVVTGLDEPGEPDHALLRRAAGSTQSDDEIAPYRFGPAVSPHLAAALAGHPTAQMSHIPPHTGGNRDIAGGGGPIDPARLMRAAMDAAADADTFVCEGVGGLLVPLSPDYLVRDFAADLGLPVVIAASAGLGTINHTLLTLEAARAAGIKVAAVVLTPWPERPGAIEKSNLETIAALGAVDVQTLPKLDLANPAAWSRLSRVTEQLSP